MTLARHLVVLTAAIALLGATSLTADAQTSTRTAVRAAAEPSFDGRSLTEWVSDLDGAAPVTRTTAAYALASMGPAGVKAVPALVKTLSDEVPTVRYPAAYALGEMGEAAVDAVPALEKLLGDRSEDIAHMARKALKKITGKEYKIADDD